MEVLQRTANRGSISTGYDIDNSLKIEADNAERLQRVYSGQSGSVNSSTPTSTKIATISFWLKRTELQPSGNHLVFLADANFTWVGFNNDGLYILGSTAGINLRSNGKFRDTSAWYHIVVAFDTTQSTASNRVKVYVNGEQWTEFGVSENYGTQNNDIDLYDTNTSHYLGWSDAQSQSGYYAEFYLIDGQQLAPTEFGETDSDSGIWKPKAYGGTFGNQGYHLDFEDSSDLGKDVSGNGNNFTAHYGGSAADQATDTPTNNFAHWNPLMAYDGDEGRAEITEGGTTLTNSNTGNGSSNGWYGGAGTIPVTSGKWYWEYQPFAGTFGYRGVGIMGADYVTDDIDDIRDYGPNLYLRDGATPKIYQHLQSGTNTVYKTMTSWTSNNSDIFAIALNMDDEEITFYRNGTAITENGTSNTTFSISSVIAQSSPIIFHYQSYANGTGIYFNFGGYTEISISSAASDANGYGTFEYAPPSGYYALCGKNLAEYGGTA